MKRIIRTAAYIFLAAAAAGCAKAVSEEPNAGRIRYFESWMHVNHPELADKPSGLGIYVLEEEAGTGDEVRKDGFVYAEYVVTDLEGNITSYTDKETAKRLGQYDTTYYYGPKVMTTIEQTIPAGLADALIGMKVGGRKKVIIPGWLMSYASYGTGKEYMENVTTGSNTIYDISVKDFTEKINKYERDLIDRYIADNSGTFNNIQTSPDASGADTTFYYQPYPKAAGVRDAEEDENKFKSDTTIYINYTGRLLNGLVFDTTVEKTAKDNGLYSSSKTYEPVEIHWGEKYTDIKMGSSESSVISGFALTLWQMHPGDKGGIGVFSSPLGYSYNGSGKSIPGYSPLVFEIEIVDKPED